MTTDAEIEEMFCKCRRAEGAEGDYVERIFEAYLETPKRRTLLATSMFGTAQVSIDFALVKRRHWAGGCYGVTDWIKRFEKLKAALTGEEVFDKTRFLSLYSDLRSLQDEINAVRPQPVYRRSEWSK